MAAAEHTAYTAIVPELPSSVVSGRKVAAMAIFENQLAQVEQVIPKSLPRNGWISATVPIQPDRRKRQRLQ